MDEKETQPYTTYRVDQEILDARGIKMTVQEVVTLPTVRYSERVHSLNLAPDDLAFVKCLRRRIKNRLASQNSRKRSMEHLRRLSRELSAVRKCKGERETERECLLEERQQVYEKCRRLREFIQKNIKDKSPIPELPNYVDVKYESQRTINVPEEHRTNTEEQRKDQSPKNIETRLYDMFSNQYEKRIVCAKTIFLNEAVKKSIDNSLLVKELNRPIRVYENSIFTNTNSALSIKQFSALYENSVEKVFDMQDNTQPVKQFDRSLKQNGSIFENKIVSDKMTSLFDNKNTNSSVKQIYNSLVDKNDAQAIKQSNKLCDSIFQNGEYLSMKQSKKLCDSIFNDKVTQSIKQSMKLSESLFDNCDAQSIKQSDGMLVKQCEDNGYCDTREALNLSLKQGRKSHGRKQTAPRRLVTIASNDFEDCVLDLKVRRDGQ